MTIDELFEMVKDPSIGFVAEVDLHYPPKLYEWTSDFPLCAERATPPGGKNEKLLLTLHDKKNYVIYHEMLKFVIREGLVVTKIHRILKFNQQPFLKSYIDLNTLQRANAKDEFRKNLFKLLSNSIYGKTMENVRNRRDIRLKMRWDGRYGLKKYIASPNFKCRTIFDENLVAVEMHKTKVFLNKPIIIGMVILDISKLCMLDFHYCYMKPKYGTNCSILYTGLGVIMKQTYHNFYISYFFVQIPIHLFIKFKTSMISTLI